MHVDRLKQSSHLCTKAIYSVHDCNRFKEYCLSMGVIVHYACQLSIHASFACTESMYR